MLATRVRAVFHLPGVASGFPPFRLSAVWNLDFGVLFQRFCRFPRGAGSNSNNFIILAVNAVMYCIHALCTVCPTQIFFMNVAGGYPLSLM